MARALRSWRAALALCVASASGCGDAGESSPRAPRLDWADIVEHAPDPNVVREESLRAALEGTGLPWRVRDRTSGVELLLVPPGEGWRGADEADGEAAADERPRHPVVAVEPFYLGRFEVTQAEWTRVMGDAPSFFPVDPAGPGQPVEQVGWFRVQEFLGATGLALPTEAQWEYGCRAGDPSPRYGPADEVAWHRGNAGGRAHTVGGKAANALGFHDLLGNVWEWTAGGYMADEYSRHRAPLDVRNSVRTSPKPVLRGGSWYDTARRARASARYAVERDFSGGHVGFRVCRAP
jgi:formylglycine-generating enzyme required for sulfatase activity